VIFRVKQVVKVLVLCFAVTVYVDLFLSTLLAVLVTYLYTILIFTINGR